MAQGKEKPCILAHNQTAMHTPQMIIATHSTYFKKSDTKRATQLKTPHPYRLERRHREEFVGASDGHPPSTTELRPRNVYLWLYPARSNQYVVPAGAWGHSNPSILCGHPPRCNACRAPVSLKIRRIGEGSSGGRGVWEALQRVSHTRASVRKGAVLANVGFVLLAFVIWLAGVPSHIFLPSCSMTSCGHRNYQRTRIWNTGGGCYMCIV